MKNKILVEVIIPEIDERYNLFLPMNKKIGNIILLINKALVDIKNGNYRPNDGAILYNRETGIKYSSSSLLRETNIRNGSILILM